MNKFLFLVLLCFLPVSVCFGCDKEKVIVELLKNEEAIIQKTEYQDQFFFPILDAVVENKTLLVRTYGGDSFPVEIKFDGGEVELLNVTYLLYVKGMSTSGAAFKVKNYQGSRTFVQPHFDKACNFGGRVDIVVKKRDGSIERGGFNVYKLFQASANTYKK